MAGYNKQEITCSDETEISFYREIGDLAIKASKERHKAERSCWEPGAYEESENMLFTDINRLFFGFYLWNEAKRHLLDSEEAEIEDDTC